MLSPNGRTAIFLDRDNTLVRDVPYCARPQDLRLLDGVGEAIRSLNNLGLLTIVITNQSGIARGLFTPEQLKVVHDELARQLGAHGARIDAIYYCPHLPTDGCACRKPRTRLFERACVDLAVDRARSFVVGDRGSDIEAGLRLGCRTVFLQNEIGSSELAKLGIAPTLSFPSLRDFVEALVSMWADRSASPNPGVGGTGIAFRKPEAGGNG